MTSDLAEIGPLMSRFLSAVSFRQGEQPSYGDLPNLFAPDARLIRNSGVAPETLTVDEFVSARQRAVDARELTSFEETELSEITELFGNVAHRFSTYAKQGVTNGYPIDVRGAISTQFIEHLTASESARWLGTTSGPGSPFPRCCHKSITLIVDTVLRPVRPGLHNAVSEKPGGLHGANHHPSLR